MEASHDKLFPSFAAASHSDRSVANINLCSSYANHLGPRPECSSHDLFYIQHTEGANWGPIQLQPSLLNICHLGSDRSTGRMHHLPLRSRDIKLDAALKKWKIRQSRARRKDNFSVLWNTFLINRSTCCVWGEVRMATEDNFKVSNTKTELEEKEHVEKGNRRCKWRHRAKELPRSESSTFTLVRAWWIWVLSLRSEGEITSLDWS